MKYAVRTLSGYLICYCDTEEESIANAQERNREAEKLQITTRYAASTEE